jgi:hypothetical protein
MDIPIHEVLKFMDDIHKTHTLKTQGGTPLDKNPKLEECWDGALNLFYGELSSKLKQYLKGKEVSNVLG